MKKLLILMFSLVLGVTLAFSGYDDSGPKDFEPTYYDNAKVLRVKYTQGEAYVKRDYDDGFEEAAINLPIFEKDIAGTTDGRLEVYLGRMNYLRLDYDTEVMIDRAPELRKTDLSLRIIKGGIYLDVDNLDFERDIEIQTPDCGIFVLARGIYRVNVNEGGRTEVYVLDGIAEVAGENYNRNVRENQKIVMFDGQVKERPFYFYSSDKDDFDQWNRERNSIVGYARSSSSQYLESGYEEYEHELSRNGRWKYDNTYNSYIWIPYHVGNDWRPYYHGRWVWTPYYGNVWMSFDSWGSFTHHYGRWHWDPIYRWYWIPGYRWSPAWVSWFWDDHHYGWCPLSWWNRPVIVYDGRWWRDHHYRRGIPGRARSSIIIKKSHLAAGGIHRVALKQNVIAKKSISFKGNAPRGKPVISKVGVINAKGKRVLYKENGIFSASKYKAARPGPGAKTGVTAKKTVVYKYSGKSGPKSGASKYSTPVYKKSKDTIKSRDTGTSFKSYKYKSDKSASGKYKSTGTYKSDKSASGKYKSTGTYKSDRYTSGSSKTKSSSTYKSTKPRSGSSAVKSKKSSSSGSKSKSKSGSKTDKPKKKKDGPSYSASYRSSDSSDRYSPGPGSYSSSYSSRAKAKSSYKSKSYSSSGSKSSSQKTYYKPSSSKKSSTYSSSRGSSSYSRSTSRSSGSGKTSSYRSPSKSSYKSSYRSGKSYSSPSSRSSSRSSSSSYKSSSGSSSSSYKSGSKSSSRGSSSSSSRSSSSRSSSGRSSSSSSPGSAKKK